MHTINNIRRSFFIILLVITTFTSSIPLCSAFAAETYYGGAEIADKDYIVYSSNNFKNPTGKIFQYEGYTVLVEDGPSGYAKVQYCTSSGVRTGYIIISVDEYPPRHDGLATVKTASKVYFGRTDQNGDYGSYNSAGSVSVGEYVAVLAKNDNWAYIEYNTSSKRKRGYIKYSNLNIINRPRIFADLHSCTSTGSKKSGTRKKINGRKYVYSGPTSLYTKVGYVENEYVTVYDVDFIYDNNNNEHESTYIEYESGGKTKSGFLVFGPWYHYHVILVNSLF